MLNLASFKIKAIIILVIVALCGGAFWYVRHLQSTVDSLKIEKVELKNQVASQKDTIEEDDRRDGIVDQVVKLGDGERQQITKVYQTKIQKVDNDVKEGKDRNVGPLLNEFFNGGL